MQRNPPADLIARWRAEAIALAASGRPSLVAFAFLKKWGAK